MSAVIWDVLLISLQLCTTYMNFGGSTSPGLTKTAAEVPIILYTLCYFQLKFSIPRHKTRFCEQTHLLKFRFSFLLGLTGILTTLRQCSWPKAYVFLTLISRRSSLFSKKLAKTGCEVFGKAILEAGGCGQGLAFPKSRSCADGFLHMNILHVRSDTNSHKANS